jgi:hypothetical protein
LPNLLEWQRQGRHINHNILVLCKSSCKFTPLFKKHEEKTRKIFTLRVRFNQPELWLRRQQS